MELLLPVDVVVAKEFAADAEHKVVAIDQIPADWEGLDIGLKRPSASLKLSRRGHRGLERSHGSI